MLGNRLPLASSDRAALDASSIPQLCVWNGDKACALVFVGEDMARLDQQARCPQLIEIHEHPLADVESLCPAVEIEITCAIFDLGEFGCGALS